MRSVNSTVNGRSLGARLGPCWRSLRSPARWRCIRTSRPSPTHFTAGLGPRGLALVTELWTEYGDWRAARLVILRELAIVADTLAGDLDPRLRFAAQRSYALLHSKLDLKD